MLGKKPLDFIMRAFHDAMELLLEYERDPGFVPNADELVLLNLIERQSLDSYVMIHKMRDRAKST